MHKARLIIIVSFLILGFQSYAQYEVKSRHILNPDLYIDYVRNNANFWIEHAFDPGFGGFFSNVDQLGNVTTMTPQRTGFAKTPYKRKSLIVQSRHGYGFTRAFMLTGDETYLGYAESALDFLFNYGWDKVNDGWFAFAQENGTIDLTQNWSPDLNQKWSFQQHYALLGTIANFEATRSPASEEFVIKGMNALNNKMWDGRSGYEGYYSTADLNWANKKSKGFTPTIDAITTNAELNYLITQDAAYKNRLLQLADMIVDHFIPQMDNPNVKALYPEVYSTNWVVDLTASKTGNVGHFIKTAWCLGRAYLCDTTKQEYKDAAVKILNQAWTYKNGDVSIWDHENGGPFNEINILTGDWTGPKGKVKEYWVVEQGFTGPMINYYITKDETYLKMADQSMHFFMEHFVDSVNGEIFNTLDPTGTNVIKGTKGDDYKSGYHSTEMGYYGYLYSNLYYLNQPASLYYKFAPSDKEQQITLTPIPMQEGKLSIKSVTLDGDEFTAFNSNSRTLYLSANQGGKFKVTFEPVGSDPNSLASTSSKNVVLYPNPVVDFVNIQGLEQMMHVAIIDMTGKVVYQYNLDGREMVQLDLSNMHAGVYFMILQQRSGEKLMKKFIKQ